MANPPKTISSYLRFPGRPFRLHCKDRTGQTKSASDGYKWQDIKTVKDWDAFNQSPVQDQFWHLIYENQHNSLVQPCIPFANTIIISELHLQTSLHMGLLAKVNLALEAITNRVEGKDDEDEEEEEEEDEHEYGKIMNLASFEDEGEEGDKKENEDEDEDEDETDNSQANNSNFGEPEEQTGTSADQEEATNLLPTPLVGDIKMHSDWDHSMWKDVDKRGKCFRQVLSQVNYYMTQNATQHGFVLTEKELVAVYRPGRKGLLKVSRSFPIYTRAGGASSPPSPPRDLCGEEALLALILWAADPPLNTDPADETYDVEAEEDEYYLTVDVDPAPSDRPSSAETGSSYPPGPTPTPSPENSSPEEPPPKRTKR